jgi:hypothetical protein
MQGFPDEFTEKGIGVFGADRVGAREVRSELVEDDPQVRPFRPGYVTVQ